MKKKNIISVILAIMSLAANAQSGTNSPYSQYGFGVMSDQSLGYSRGMGGLSLGLRGNNIVNMLNPASYSDVDSLTMIFDLGLSGQVTNFEECRIYPCRTKSRNIQCASASFSASHSKNHGLCLNLKKSFLFIHS